MKNLLFYCFGILLFFPACKNTTNPPTTDSSMIDLPSQKPSEVPVNPQRARLDSIAISELSTDIWHYVNTIAMMGKAKDTGEDKGKYLIFNKDMTFEKGLYEEKTNSGKWTYNSKKRLMDLDFEEEGVKNEQWRVFRKENDMVLIGTINDLNKGVQIKMTRQKERPKKPQE